MRKIALLVAMLLVLVASIPVSAQETTDGNPTIADIIISLATAEEDAEFTVLLAAIQAADPSLLEILSNPEAELTVFAPTDVAFGTLLEEFSITADVLLSDVETLNAVLAYHVLPSAAIDSNYFLEILSENNEVFVGSVVDDAPFSFIFDDGLFVGNTDFGYAEVILTDIYAANGIIHVIDAVLLPVIVGDYAGLTFDVEETIADIVLALASDNEPEFSILLDAMLAADESILRLLSNEDSAITIFAPTDAAFLQLLASMDLTAEELLTNAELLTVVLAYHIVPGIITSPTLASYLTSDFYAVGIQLGTFLPVSLGLTLGTEGVVINDSANVIIADVEAANGVIHVIDAVLIP